MIYLTRHGQTDWNVQKKVMGRCDEPLNEKGREQARQTKELLSNINFDLIICSPLLRAKEIAQIINQDRNIKIEYDDRIIERDFGELEGLETKINQTKPNLLLKQELENFIKEAGFENYKFYYPLPDYTNTSSIFTDDFLPKSNHSKIVYPLNYEIDSNVVFNEINVIKQICDM